MKSEKNTIRFWGKKYQTKSSWLLPEMLKAHLDYCSKYDHLHSDPARLILTPDIVLD
jgi:hypothetical protein